MKIEVKVDVNGPDYFDKTEFICELEEFMLEYWSIADYISAFHDMDGHIVKFVIDIEDK